MRLGVGGPAVQDGRDECQYSLQSGPGIGRSMERGQKRDGRCAAAVAFGVGFPGGHEVCLSTVRATLRGARYGRQRVAALGLLAASHRFAGAGAAGDMCRTRGLASGSALGAGGQRVHVDDGRDDPVAGPADERVGRGAFAAHH